MIKSVRINFAIIIVNSYEKILLWQKYDKMCDEQTLKQFESVSQSDFNVLRCRGL